MSRLHYTTDHVYKPDFTLADGSFLEAKGYLDYEERSKLVAVKKAHPGIPLVLLFQKPNNKISKKDKALTYAQWAERNGFRWVTLDTINKLKGNK